MSHIHTKPGQHDFTSSAFIVRLDGDKPKLLLHMHKLLGKLLQPGGHVELTENPWQAVLREITEETGYKLQQLKVLQPKDRLKKLNHADLHPMPVCQNTHNFSDTHKHTDSAYAFSADSLPAGKPASGESKKFNWVDIDELNKLSKDVIFENVREISIYVLTICIKDWEPVDIS
jgi:8-oxo-dGTP diphosphatase